MSTVMSVCASHAPGLVRDAQAEHGLGFRAGLARAAEAIAHFDPSMVVMFGSDHRRAFTDVVPAVAVCLGSQGLGDHGSATGAYRVPEELAVALAADLLVDGFDVAVTRGLGLDHGFGQAAELLLGGLASYPVIPVFINCATPPFMPPGRAAALGAAIGAALDARCDRVLYLGSGGLSHDPPTLALVPNGVSEEERRALSARYRDAAKAKVSPDWDEDFLQRLTSADPTWARQVTQESIDPAGIGANEVRTWLAAYSAASVPMRTVAYEPVLDWITGMGVAMSLPSQRPGARQAMP